MPDSDFGLRMIGFQIIRSCGEAAASGGDFDGGRFLDGFQDGEGEQHAGAGLLVGQRVIGFAAKEHIAIAEKLLSDRLSLPKCGSSASGVFGSSTKNETSRLQIAPDGDGLGESKNSELARRYRR